MAAAALVVAAIVVGVNRVGLQTAAGETTPFMLYLGAIGFDDPWFAQPVDPTGALTPGTRHVDRSRAAGQRRRRLSPPTRSATALERCAR